MVPINAAVRSRVRSGWPGRDPVGVWGPDLCKLWRTGRRARTIDSQPIGGSRSSLRFPSEDCPQRAARSPGNAPTTRVACALPGSGRCARRTASPCAPAASASSRAGSSAFYSAPLFCPRGWCPGRPAAAPPRPSPRSRQTWRGSTPPSPPSRSCRPIPPVSRRATTPAACCIPLRRPRPRPRRARRRRRPRPRRRRPDQRRPRPRRRRPDQRRPCPRRRRAAQRPPL